MKKINLFLALMMMLALSFDSCEIVGLGSYDIKYKCYNQTSGTVSIVYTGADGRNVLDTPIIGPMESWESDVISFSKGDYFSIQAQLNGEERSWLYVSLNVHCVGCENLGNEGGNDLDARLDPSKGSLIELSGNIE